ncbi:MAG: ATP-binding protein [Myxococcales bacterium]|nr:ATP-binding protein [Myxococcales bacterium]
MTTSGGTDFRARARVEADRYGPDAWIFVRELLQNARDAGATKVTITASEEGGRAIVRCRDDGEGMSFAHAQSYLFRLYSSSKESRSDQVGRFGVGFWSILRFDPERIVVRSRPQGGEAWQIELTGDLKDAYRQSSEIERGTEIILERAAGDGAIARRIWDAAHQNARFITRRDDRERPLEVTINGEPIAAAFELPAPSSAFRRRGLRGVVGLGNAARVELFSRGLRVRSAATLDDFVSNRGRHTARSRVQFTELQARLAPQAILESDRLEVLLSRADARENRALRRLVRLAQRELERLLNRQLDAARPLPWWRRWPQTLRLLLRNSLALRTGLAAVAGAAIAVLISLALWGDRLRERFLDPPPTAPAGARPLAAGGPAIPGENSGEYSDLASLYRGPQIDELPGDGSPVDLRYEPADESFHFAALLYDEFDEDGAPRSSEGALRPYRGAACRDPAACVSVELRARLVAGPNRVPVPTGHRLEVASLRFDGEALEVRASADDEAMVIAAGDAHGILSYRTAPEVPRGAAPAPRRPRGLPPAIAREARALRERPPMERVNRLTELVSERVAYSIDRRAREELERAQRAGKGLFERTLELGRGDCDVQNALLVALLHEAEIPARLAIGYVGREGRSSPWHHAWAEYRIGEGPWAIADASANARPLALAEATPQPPPAGLPAVAAPPAPQPPWIARPLPIAAALFAALALALLVLRRTQRTLALETSTDLSHLLRGVLQHPESFSALPAVFQRPLIPVSPAGALSIEEARAMATDGVLFRTRARSPLAEAAIAGGTRVLDDAIPEARTVADALGAIDLDAWHELLERGEETPLLAAVNRHLHELGESWWVIAATGIGRGARTLDLGLLRLPHHPLRGRRVIVIERGDPWLEEASAALSATPEAALFAALDRIAETIDLASDRRGRLLLGSARALLREVGR